MSVDPFQHITERLLRQVSPQRRSYLLKAAAGQDLLLSAVDAWVHEMTSLVRGLKADHGAMKKHLKENDTGAELADLRKRIDDLYRADALAARTVPALPRPVAISKADDIGGTDNFTKKRH
jgi:hypothetical protein